MDDLKSKPLFLKYTHVVAIAVIMSGPYILASLAEEGGAYAMEIKDGQLKIPTPEITLIWEHYCMKHMAQNEFHLARLNKRAIEFQRANKLYWNSSPDQFDHFQAKLAEAQSAKDKAGASWACNLPDAKLAFIKIKVGQDGGENIPKSFISTSGTSVATEGVVTLLDSNCRNPEIKWISSVPKYGVSETKKMSLSTAEGDEEIVVDASGLSSDETSYACTEEKTDSAKKMGTFTAVTGSFRCGYVTYDVSQIRPVLVGEGGQTAAIPSVPNGDRGGGFKVEIEAKLFCDGILADNINTKIRQDEKDQLRQEYLDMGKKTIPEKKDLVSELKTAHFNLADFNSSLKAGGGKYGHILCRILDKLESVRGEAREVQMYINSGYRNPYKNGRLENSGRESQHLYGMAADIDLRDFDGDGRSDKKDWEIMSSAAKNMGACVEPYNLAPSWVHMDWRGTCPSGW